MHSDGKTNRKKGFLSPGYDVSTGKAGPQTKSKANQFDEAFRWQHFECRKWKTKKNGAQMKKTFIY